MNRVTVVLIGAAAAFAASCARTPSPETCDRECLVGLADGYLAAVAAHDPAAVPLADDVRFVENITRMKPGDGLWASATAVRRFRIHVPDPAAQTVGVMTIVERRTSNGVAPAVLAVRLTLEGGTITEAEHLVGELQPTADPARLVAPRPNLTSIVPSGERMRAADMSSIAGSYYDALVAADASRAPFANDCEREENGAIAAGPGLPPAPFDSTDVQGRTPPAVARDCVGQLNSRRFAYIDAIDHRRIVAVDPVQGLAMGWSHFRQSMKKGPQLLIAADGSRVMWEEKRAPYDLPAAHIFKITGGRIHEVEAVGIFVPYGSATGW